jgi:hypothetical protein
VENKKTAVLTAVEDRPKSRNRELFLHALTLQVIGSGVWAGVENVREQKKLEARKMLENGDESHTSTARFVRRLCERKTHSLKKGRRYHSPSII